MDSVVVDKSKIDEVRNKALSGETQPETPVVTATADTPNPNNPVPDNKTDQPQGISLNQIAEDELLKEIERRGMKVSKETLTDEQLKKQQEIEELEKLQFAINNNLITQEGYLEAKQILAAEGTELTKKEFTKFYKSENPKATKEDIEAAYNDYYFVQQQITIKDKRIKELESGDKELEEFEVPVNKFDERFVKLGEQRAKNEAERIKQSAKSTLELVDQSYASFKTLKAKSADYEKAVNKVLFEIDLSAYPTTHKIQNKDISGKVKFDKPEEVKADLQNYLNTVIAPLFLQSDKYNDVAEVKRQAHVYLKEKYPSNFDETLWNLGKTEGINEAKVGASAPLQREIVSDDSRPDQLEQEIKGRIPIAKDNPVLNR